MSTYDHKQVLADYEHGKITPEMAVGHGLQHIDHLYDLLKTNQHEWQTKADALEKRANLLQTAVDRLTAFMDKVLRAQKKRADPSRPQFDKLTDRPDQP